MPPKIRQLIKHLKQADFIDRGDKCSHRNFTHPCCQLPITISGAVGDNAAKLYQVRQVQAALEDVKHGTK